MPAILKNRQSLSRVIFSTLGTQSHLETSDKMLQSTSAEQLNILSMWLKVEPENQKAIGEKKAAYNELGMDESTIDRQRWEQNPSNIKIDTGLHSRVPLKGPADIK